MTRRLAGVSMLLTALLLPVSAARAQGGRPNTWLCALTGAAECENDGDCHRRTLEEVGLLRFHVIDLGQRTITVVDRAAAGRTTALDRVERADGQVVLQGAVAGRAISAVLAEGSGRLSVAVVEAGTVFPLAGVCTPVMDAK